MKWWRRRRTPEIGPNDLLIEAEIVHADGTVRPIVAIAHEDGTSWSFEGYSSPIDLPPGASFHIDSTELLERTRRKMRGDNDE